jgi:subtilisin family serine protease
VAVIDTGVDYTHEDLQGKIILGHNYVNTSPGHVQNPDLPMDDYGHGTHVSGAIAALTNNSKGIAGLNWNGKIYAVKVLDYAGSGNISDIISGMTEAVNYGVKILNLSLGDANYSPSLENAVNYAYANGCLVVAAAGNENTNTPTYPAAFTNAFAVASTDQNDQRSVWNSSAASNYGSWVDISAPGSMIYSTWLSNSYTYKNGTSMATPLVSGLASLLLGRKPNWTPDQLRDRIQSTSDNIDGLNPGYAGQLGTGRINAGRALGMPRAQITNPASGSFVSGTVSIKGDADSMDFANYMVFVGFGSNPTSYLLLYTNNTQVINDTLYNFDSTQVADGWQTIKLSAMSNEPYTVEATVSVIVDNTKPTAIISNPADSQTVEGTVTISGTANDTNFEYYTIEYSKDSSNYFRISTSTSPQINDDLASWNTEGLSGKYFIRLTVADKANNTSQTVIEVNIASSSANKVSVMGISRPTPNPFNPATQSQTYFSYYLSQNSDVAIYLFNLSGELIWQKSYFSGEEGGKAQLNLAPWNGINLYGEIVENGVYIYKITASGDGGRKVLDSGKIIVLKN